MRVTINPFKSFSLICPIMAIEVKTEIDDIVELIKSAKEMTIDQLSNKINVNRDILEEILHFLEEQGYVKLDYRLTNTFVKYVGKPESENEIQSKAQDEVDFDYEFASLSSDVLDKKLNHIRLSINKLLFIELSLDLIQWRNLYVIVNKVLLLLSQKSTTGKKTYERLNEISKQISNLFNSAKQSLYEKKTIQYFQSIKEIYLNLQLMYKLVKDSHLITLSSRIDKLISAVRFYLLINSKKEQLFNLVSQIIDNLRAQDLNLAEANYTKVLKILELRNPYDISEMNKEELIGFSKALSFIINQPKTLDSLDRYSLDSLDRYFKAFLEKCEEFLRKLNLEKIDFDVQIQKDMPGNHDELPDSELLEIEQLKQKFFKSLNALPNAVNLKIPAQNSNKSAVQQQKMELTNPAKTTSPKQSRIEEQRKDLNNLKKVQLLLVKARRLFEENRISEALQTISSAKSTFLLITNKFYLLKKIDVGKEIYALEPKIIERYVSENRERINKIFSEISHKIEELNALLSEKNFKAFNELYLKLRTLLSSIPDNFSAEKNRLRTLLLQKLVQAQVFKAQIVNEKNHRVKTEFFRLRHLFNVAENNGDSVRMLLIYSNLQKLVNSLDDSEFKFVLLTDLDKLYTRVLDLIEKDRLNEYEMFKKSALTLLAKVDEEIKNKRFDSAREYYHKVLLLMKKAPHGFFEENNKLKEKLIKTYNNLISEMESIRKSLAPDIHV